MLHNEYDSKFSLGAKKNTGRESQGACHQLELIGRKPPVVN
jgi:hypothetical protein